MYYLLYMYTYIDRNICFEPVCSEMWPSLAPLPGQDASLTMCCGGGERWGVFAHRFLSMAARDGGPGFSWLIPGHRKT